MQTYLVFSNSSMLKIHKWVPLLIMLISSQSTSLHWSLLKRHTVLVTDSKYPMGFTLKMQLFILNVFKFRSMHMNQHMKSESVKKAVEKSENLYSCKHCHLILIFYDCMSASLVNPCCRFTQAYPRSFHTHSANLWSKLQLYWVDCTYSFYDRVQYLAWSTFWTLLAHWNPQLQCLVTMLAYPSMVSNHFCLPSFTDKSWIRPWNAFQTLPMVLYVGGHLPRPILSKCHLPDILTLLRFTLMSHGQNAYSVTTWPCIHFSIYKYTYQCKNKSLFRQLGRAGRVSFCFLLYRYSSSFRLRKKLSKLIKVHTIQQGMKVDHISSNMKYQ